MKPEGISPVISGQGLELYDPFVLVFEQSPKPFCPKGMNRDFHSFIQVPKKKFRRFPISLCKYEKPVSVPLHCYLAGPIRDIGLREPAREGSFFICTLYPKLERTKIVFIPFKLDADPVVF